MKERDYLFHLIQSLSRQEKKEFLLDAAARRGGKNAAYLALYRCYEKSSKAPSTEVLLQKFKLNRNQLAVQKNYLFGRLCHCLLNYHSHKKLNRLRNNILLVELFTNRGLTELADKLLTETESSARQVQHWPLLVSSTHSRSQWLMQQNAHVEIEKILRLELEQLKARSAETEYQLLEYTIIAFGKKVEYIRTEKERAQLHQLLFLPKLKNEKFAIGTQARIARHLAILHAANLEQLPAEQLFRSEQILLLLMKDEESTRQNLSEHLSALYLYALTVIQYGNREQLRKVILHWKQFMSLFSASMKPEHRVHIQIMKCGLFIRYHNMKGNFLPLEKFLAQAHGLMKHPLPIARILSDPMAFYKASLAFGKGNLKAALKHLVDLDFDKDFTYRQYRTAIRSLLLQLAIHYELKHVDVMERLLRSFARLVQAHERSKGVRQLLLSFFSSLIKTNSVRAAQKLFDHTYKEMLSVFSKQNDWEFYINNPLFCAWLLRHADRKELAIAAKEVASDWSRLIQRAGKQRYDFTERPLSLLA